MSGQLGFVAPGVTVRKSLKFLEIGAVDQTDAAELTGGYELPGFVALSVESYVEVDGRDQPLFLREGQKFFGFGVSRQRLSHITCFPIP